MPQTVNPHYIPRFFRDILLPPEMFTRTQEDANDSIIVLVDAKIEITYYGKILLHVVSDT